MKSPIVSTTMSESQLTVSTPAKASDQLASFLGIEKGMMLETLKAQCFTGKRPDEVTDTQLAAFVSTANILKVNPLIPGMLYAFPAKSGGIIPIIGPDGVLKRLDEDISSGKIEGFDCTVFPEDVTQKPTHAIATIHRKGAKPATYTAVFSEWVVPNSPVWSGKPRHMLWLRAIKQVARQVIHGLPMDREEYDMSDMQNVTPEPEAPKRPPAPRKARGAAAVVEAETVPVTEAAPEPKPVEPVEPVESAEQAAAATEPPKPAPEPAPKSAVPANPGQPRAFLQDAEVLECEVEVTDFKGVLLTKGGDTIPAAKATVKGGYNGEVYHLKGGTVSGEDVIPNAPWAKGAKLKVSLRGEKSVKSGRVIAYVESAAEVQEEF